MTTAAGRTLRRASLDPIKGVVETPCNVRGAGESVPRLPCVRSLSTDYHYGIGIHSVSTSAKALHVLHSLLGLMRFHFWVVKVFIF